MSIDVRTEKLTVDVHRMKQSLASERECTIDTGNTMDEDQKHGEQKKPERKYYTVYRPIAKEARQKILHIVSLHLYGTVGIYTATKQISLWLAGVGGMVINGKGIRGNFLG